MGLMPHSQRGIGPVVDIFLTFLIFYEPNIRTRENRTWYLNLS